MSAQSEAMAAQGEQSTLLQRVAILEKEVADLKAWDAEKQRYELKQLKSLALAYGLKEDAKGSEPSHYICATCYQLGFKSILQPITHYVGRATSLDCAGCGARIYETGTSHPGQTPPIQPTTRRQ